MKNTIEEKSLVSGEKQNIFCKIRDFFINLFRGNNEKKDNTKIENVQVTNPFLETVKKTEDEETKLLKLQQQYRKGEIKEEDLTEEQIAKLCNLYDKQIAELKKSIEYRTQKILKYRDEYDV